MLVHPFKALRATPTSAPKIGSVPYDIVNTEEAKALSEGNPLSFLHVVRSEIDLPAGTSLYDEKVYQKAAENLKALQQQGHLVQEESESLYAYRITMGDHTQLGLFCCCSVDEYERGIIKKHELTRRDKEDDRTRHILTMRAQAGPVLVTFQDDERVNQLLLHASEGSPMLSQTSEAGVLHEIWRISNTNDLVDAFAHIPAAYIADGHHRSASAIRVRDALRQGNSNHSGTEEYNFFLTAIFPASQMKILPYNRIVKDLNGLSPDAFFEKARQHFDITAAITPTPKATGEFCVFLDGKWHHLRIKPQYAHRDDPVLSLDCSLLQRYIIEPILGIKELRTDERIDFIGGSRGTEVLESLVDTGQATIAFSLYPTTIGQLMAIADASQIMPPKSTWFEPKLRSGLIVHPI